MAGAMARTAQEVQAPPRADREVDARGLTCPWPALRARVALKMMKRGEVLRVVATDREAPRDFARFAQSTGHALLAQSASGREFVFYLRKR
jgi:tRNA 2-thiouridine synthesizing protein A